MSKIVRLPDLTLRWDAPFFRYFWAPTTAPDGSWRAFTHPFFPMARKDVKRTLLIK